MILGAGDAGNAVAFALAERGMKVVILNRTVTKARDLADRINKYLKRTGADEMVRFGGEELIAAEIKDAAAVINVSTKGSAGELEEYSALAPANLPANKENIRENLNRAKAMLHAMPKDTIISDIMLGKKATSMLKAAKDAGFETLDGVSMVINQGVEAFWLLYGKELKAKNITKEQVAETMKRAASSNSIRFRGCHSLARASTVVFRFVGAEGFDLALSTTPMLSAKSSQAGRSG